MSYSYVHPEQNAPKRWLIAYPVAQAICLGAAAVAAAGFGMIGWVDASHQAMAVAVTVAIFYGATFGILRGLVLRKRLARFSMPGWCAAIGVASLFFLPPEPETLPALTGTSNLQATAIATLPVAMSGFVYGLVIGAAEAFSLRRAAFGLFSWAIVSGFAWGLGHIAGSAAAGFADPQELTANQIAGVQIGCMLLQAWIAGLVMLPALRLLKPRLSYYGPRIYRLALLTRNSPANQAPL
jgi:hypothetical protein